MTIKIFWKIKKKKTNDKWSLVFLYLYLLSLLLIIFPFCRVCLPPAVSTRPRVTFLKKKKRTFVSFPPCLSLLSLAEWNQRRRRGNEQDREGSRQVPLAAIEKSWLFTFFSFLGGVKLSFLRRPVVMDACAGPNAGRRVTFFFFVSSFTLFSSTRNFDAHSSRCLRSELGDWEALKTRAHPSSCQCVFG